VAHYLPGAERFDRRSQLKALCAALARNASRRELETPRPHMRECRGQCEEVNAAT
jgi:hypothetical protein